jgi:hypothetical protein
VVRHRIAIVGFAVRLSPPTWIIEKTRKLHPGLSFAIGLALGWASLVFSVFFVLIYCWPFQGWSKGDQVQLFQAMVGLAGFGGGLIGLFFAGQQIYRLRADYEVAVRYRLKGGEEFDSGVLEFDPAAGHEPAHAELLVEIVNSSDSICDDWQVVLWSDGDLVLSASGIGWKTDNLGRWIRAAAGDERLYPHVSIPIGALWIEAPPEWTAPTAQNIGE